MLIVNPTRNDPAKLDGDQALGNHLVDYGDDEINESITRVIADPFDRLSFRRRYTPTGRVGDTKVLITHTDKDDLVFVGRRNCQSKGIAPLLVARKRTRVATRPQGGSG